MKRDFFVHIHIPKCAGRTFNTLLQRNFGSGYKGEYGLLNDYQYDAGQVERMIRAYPNLRCVASHRFSLDMPWEAEGIDLHGITLIRNPREHFVSHYFFHRHSTHWLPKTKEMKLEEYVEYAFERGGDAKMVNAQTWFLTGDATENGLAAITETVEKRDLLLFPAEELAKICVILEKRYPEFFRNFYYMRENASPRDQEVSARVTEKILSYQQTDVKLYEFAKRNLERTLEKLFPDVEELERKLARFR